MHYVIILTMSQILFILLLLVTNNFGDLLVLWGALLIYNIEQIECIVQKFFL